MKKIKKLMAAVFAAAIAFCSMPAFAADVPMQTDDDVLLSQPWHEAEVMHKAEVSAASEYAYMDIDSASPEMHEKILEARETIIFSQSWAVDGVEAYVIDVDGTIEVLSKFSELFPGWDVPVLDTSAAQNETETARNTSAFAENFRTYLDAPPTSGNSAPFFAFGHHGTYIQTTVMDLTSSRDCNIGYSVYETGESLAYRNNLLPGQTFGIKTTSNAFNCAVRASTLSTPGWGTLRVAHDAYIAI